jgi:hypothetical protein
MLIKKTLYKLQDNFFNLFILLSWILVIISALGLSAFAPHFLDNLDYYVRIYICLFLIWRFHPFKTNYEFTELDRKIAFSAGLFILTTTALNQYLLDFQNKIKNIIKLKKV